MYVANYYNYYYNGIVYNVIRKSNIRTSVCSLCGLLADIDECQPGGNNCNQTCSNTVGSYQCNCTPGYSLQEDGVTCTGVYTCIPVFRLYCMCGLVCVHVGGDGSVNTYCMSLCTLDLARSMNCIWLTYYSLCGLFPDIDECQTGEHNCNQTCSNRVGSFECGCMPGYSLQDDNVTCTGECMHLCYCACVV